MQLPSALAGDGREDRDMESVPGTGSGCGSMPCGDCGQKCNVCPWSVHGLSMVGGAGLTKGENSVALAVSVRSSLGAALVWQSSADSPG
jgi:hypothetical protein